MISKDRQKHIFGVANFMKSYAVSQGLSQEEIEDIYTLGLLHDIGYEFLNKKEYAKHNVVGGGILKKQNYKFWKEVYYHGTPNCKYQSRLLDLLNWADMRIDGQGKIVSFDERLKDASLRYSTPIENLSCYKIICELKAKGYK